MKKGIFSLLLVTAAFVCVMTGVLIGRHTSGNLYSFHEQRAAQAHVPLEAETEPAVSPKLDINTATAAELADLPGIGDILASRIIDYRNENGQFSSVDDLALIEGIGEKKVDAIREYITVGGQYEDTGS